MTEPRKNIDQYWEEFVDFLRKPNRNGYPDFFYHYTRHIMRRQGFEKYVLNAKYLFELCHRPIKGAKILDVGCGFGIDSMIFASLGAEVYGIDVNPDWIETIHAYLTDLKWDLPIETKVGDASKLDYPDNTFDVVLSVEAISHYRDVDNFLEESFRVSRRGGVLIVSDGNNGANPRIRRKTHEIWRRFEHGPPTDSFYGHQIKRSFIDMRREIITKNFPDLSPAKVPELAKNTFGMGDKEIVAAVADYLQNGAKPDSPFKAGVPAFNPIKNDYIERLFDPNSLVRQMNQIGFNAKAYAHFGGAGQRGVIGTANAILRAFSPITMQAARAFKIVASKP